MVAHGTRCFMTDLPSIETDEACGMRYWLSHFEAGNGIRHKDQIIPALMNQAIHADLRALSTMEDISMPAIQAVITDALSGLSSEDIQDIGKMELLYQRLGWFAAFALFMEPDIRRDYETLPVSELLSLDRDPLWVFAAPDRVLKEKSTGDISYREYVPYNSGLSQKKWLQSWHYNIRLHLGLAAAAGNSLSPSYGQVMGLSKGFVSLLDNRLVHPYTWGYKNMATGEWATARKAEADWILTPVWAYPGGLTAWVQFCGRQVAEAQFPLSPPVFLNEEILKGWSARRLHREREISSIRGVAALNFNLREINFPKITSSCYPVGASPCQYLKACWDEPTSKAPLSCPDYVVNPGAKES